MEQLVSLVETLEPYSVCAPQTNLTQRYGDHVNCVTCPIEAQRAQIQALRDNSRNAITQLLVLGETEPIIFLGYLANYVEAAMFLNQHARWCRHRNKRKTSDRGCSCQ